MCKSSVIVIKMTKMTKRLLTDDLLKTITIYDHYVRLRL